ncbi:MAG: RNA polymerase factor sigma-54 [Bacillota bacterium]
MSYSLSLQQQQKLVMTPELRQAIAILQMNTLELSQHLEEQLLQNPVLELSEDAYEEGEEAGNHEEPDWLEYFGDCSDLGLGPPVQRDPERRMPELRASGPSLREHLLAQLNLGHLSRLEQLVGEFIIGSLNDDGYLSQTIDEIAGHLKVDAVVVGRVLGLIQGCDPPGVGARDLSECLHLQLDFLGVDSPVARSIVEHHLQDLAAGKFQRIAQCLRVDIHAVQAAADLIRSLNPRPGLSYPTGQVNYVTPDLVVERVGGEYVIIVNDTLLPRLTLSPYYRQLVVTSSDPSTRKFLQDRLSSAVWLLRSVEQRRLTLYRVMESIVTRQRDFFNYGIRYLKPLTLKEIGDELELHESTVSRATAHKYAQTPHGVFSLRFFFRSGVQGLAGTAVSSESVKVMIRDLVAAEDSRRPLSDQNLAGLLGQRGITISRRTVTKYREEMEIPASAKRRRY